VRKETGRGSESDKSHVCVFARVRAHTRALHSGPPIRYLRTCCLVFLVRECVRLPILPRASTRSRAHTHTRTHAHTHWHSQVVGAIWGLAFGCFGEIAPRWRQPEPSDVVSGRCICICFNMRCGGFWDGCIKCYVCLLFMGPVPPWLE